MFSTRDEDHFFTGAGQMRAEVSAGTARSENCKAHEPLLLSMGLTLGISGGHGALS
jgi:hypothetical protein